MLVAKTGFCFEIYLNKLNIDKAVLLSCVKKGLIKKDKPVFIFTNLMNPYLLTQNGKEFASNKLSVRPYRTHLSRAEHDYVLGNVYIGLSKSEQISWESETSLGVKYPSQAVVDGRFTSNDNKLVGVEVITEAYSENEIDNKLSFLKLHCDKKIVLYTKDIAK